MNIPFTYPGFENRNLSIDTSMFTHPSLRADGSVVPKNKNTFLLTNNAGEPVEFKPKQNIFDPGRPRVQIGGDTIKVGTPLQWYEYVLTYLPLLFVLGGIIIGLGLGSFAIIGNFAVMRSNLPVAVRYALAIGIFIVGFVVLLVIGTLFQLLRRM